LKSSEQPAGDQSPPLHPRGSTPRGASLSKKTIRQDLPLFGRPQEFASADQERRRISGPDPQGGKAPARPPSCINQCADLPIA